MGKFVVYEGDSTASAAIITHMNAAGCATASMATIMRANGADVLIMGETGT
jgi:hypothetical protein